jgi:MFS family permease
VVRFFSISIFWVYQCLFSLPAFFTIMALEQGVSGLSIGLVLALPAFVAILTTHLINHYIAKLGIEESILYSMIMFGLGNCIMAATSFCQASQGFLWVACLASVIIGFTIAGLTVGESALLLRYSRSQDREKNLGIFRAATGLGGLVSPLTGSLLYALGGFSLIFLINGLVCFLLAPFVYRRIKAASVDFVKLGRSEDDQIPLL